MGGGNSSISVGNGRSLQNHFDIEAVPYEFPLAVSTSGRFELRLGFLGGYRRYRDTYVKGGENRTITDFNEAQRLAGVQIDNQLPFVDANLTTGATDFDYAIMVGGKFEATGQIFRHWWMGGEVRARAGVFVFNDQPDTLTINRLAYDIEDECQNSTDPYCRERPVDQDRLTFQPGRVDSPKLGFDSTLHYTPFDIQFGHHVSWKIIKLRALQVTKVIGFPTDAHLIWEDFNIKNPPVDTELSVWWGGGRKYQSNPAIEITQLGFPDSAKVADRKYIAEKGTALPFTVQTNLENIPTGATVKKEKITVKLNKNGESNWETIDPANYATFVAGLDAGEYTLFVKAELEVEVDGKTYKDERTREIKLVINEKKDKPKITITNFDLPSIEVGQEAAPVVVLVQENAPAGSTLTHKFIVGGTEMDEAGFKEWAKTQAAADYVVTLVARLVDGAGNPINDASGNPIEVRKDATLKVKAKQRTAVQEEEKGETDGLSKW